MNIEEQPAVRERARVKRIPKKISNMKRAAVMVRWESVQLQREQWLDPFHKLPLERAMAYLEDLRKVCEQAAYILNDRLGNDPNKMRCACGCGKDLSGLQPNGRPRWIAKKDFRDKRHPEIIHSLYFFETICEQKWVRQQHSPCKCGHLRADHGMGTDRSCTQCDCRKYEIADKKLLETGVIT